MSQLKMQAMALGGGAGTVALKELAVSPGKSSKPVSLLSFFNFFLSFSHFYGLLPSFFYDAIPTFSLPFFVYF